MNRALTVLAAALLAGRSNHIPIQLQAAYGNSYTDAAAVSQEGTGIPSISLGIPIRYSHAPSSVCHLGDMEACLKLAEVMLRRGIEAEDLHFLQ